MMRRRARKLGGCYLADRLALAAYSRLFLLRGARRHPAWRTVHAAADFTPRCRVLHVPSINASQVAELLSELAPEVVIVAGTGIIGRSVLAAAPRFVNLHAGITPLYRGAHGAVWAVICEDFDNLGTTLHRVDEGIDTGGILRQARFELEPATDDLLTLQARQNVGRRRGAGRLVALRRPPTKSSRRRLARVASFTRPVCATIAASSKSFGATVRTIVDASLVDFHVEP